MTALLMAVFVGGVRWLGTPQAQAAPVQNRAAIAALPTIDDFQDPAVADAMFSYGDGGTFVNKSVATTDTVPASAEGNSVLRIEYVSAGWGAGTCREHQGLCHAADGEPALLTPAQPQAAPATPPPPPTSTTPKAPPAKTAKGSRSVKSTASSKKSQPVRPGQKAPEPKITAKQVQVIISATEPVIAIRAMRTASRPYALRTIELIPDGILVSCECEKEKCQVNGWVHRPASADYLSKQIEKMVERVSIEYNFPANKVEYVMLYALDRRPLRGFTLPPVWLDEVRLELARQGFDAKD